MQSLWLHDCEHSLQFPGTCNRYLVAVIAWATGLEHRAYLGEGRTPDKALVPGVRRLGSEESLSIAPTAPTEVQPV